MTKPPIDIAIIGAGRMGLTHYSLVNAHPAVRVCGVVEPSLALRRVLGKFCRAPMFTDYREMLDAARPTALVVSTPPDTHYEIVAVAADRGVHAFVEKPFTLRSDDARELARRFAEQGLINQVGYVNRFNDVFQFARRLVREGALGRVVRYRSDMHSRTVIAPVASRNWRSARSSGGGVTYEMASHALNLAQYLLGRPGCVIGSRLTSVYSPDADDVVSTTLVHDDGLTGTVYVNWSDESVRKPTNTIEVFGDKGKLVANQHSVSVSLHRPSEPFGLPAGWTNRYITDLAQPVPFYVRGNEYTNQLWSFIELVQAREGASTCSFEEAADTLLTIERIFTDAGSKASS
jgi:scyllo-inositol 2-dehydrogenase (NADP+)